MKRRGSFLSAGLLAFVDLNTMGAFKTLAQVHKTIEYYLDIVNQVPYSIASGDFDEGDASGVAVEVRNDLQQIILASAKAVKELDRLKASISAF